MDIADSGSQRSPSIVWSKLINELVKTVSLILNMCRPVFGTGKAVVLDSVFFVAKCITEL